MNEDDWKQLTEYAKVVLSRPRTQPAQDALATVLNPKTGDAELVTITREDYNATKQRLADLEAALTIITERKYPYFESTADLVAAMRHTAAEALNGKAK